jgi:hypothetical protein
MIFISSNHDFYRTMGISMSIRDFFRRNKSRAYVPITGDGRATEDWKIGDLAVCIANTWTEYETGEQSSIGPQVGHTYRVSWVGMKHGYHILCLVGQEPWFTAHSFRKAIIDKAEACDEEFVTLLNRSKELIPAWP